MSASRPEGRGLRARPCPARRLAVGVGGAGRPGRPRAGARPPGHSAAIDGRSPVAVLMMFVLHLVPDEQDPQRVVATYRDALAPGSYLALSHASADVHPDLMARISAIYARANSPFVPRCHADIPVLRRLRPGSAWTGQHVAVRRAAGHRGPAGRPHRLQRRRPQAVVQPLEMEPYWFQRTPQYAVTSRMSPP
ncbi:SAM-dependent methyltransferase [Micromonospora vinacea]|uniref:SAM-dependent methyltransferase n=1 Tax=Micromonospora vinacea TaxID=709878 RepID=UPI00344DE32D